jgi:hypothetical protein
MQSAAAQYSPDPSLTPVQHHVLSLLAHGVSITEAAAAADIHRNTVANWRRTDPAFAREFEFAARERSLFWHDQAAALAHKAIEVMTTILNDETAAPSLRLRVALKIVGMASDPKPEPIMLQAPTQADPVETVHNSAQSCTIQPIRRPAGRTCGESRIDSLLSTAVFEPVYSETMSPTNGSAG